MEMNGNKGMDNRVIVVAIVSAGVAICSAILLLFTVYEIIPIEFHFGSFMYLYLFVFTLVLSFLLLYSNKQSLSLLQATKRFWVVGFLYAILFIFGLAFFNDFLKNVLIGGMSLLETFIYIVIEKIFFTKKNIENNPRAHPEPKPPVNNNTTQVNIAKNNYIFNCNINVNSDNLNTLVPPQDLNMAKLYIGISDYDYPEWQNIFYPQELKRKDFLSYYATQFNSLELNGTYYKMPTPEQMQNMITRTDSKVIFTVKAFKDLTHAEDKTNYQPTAAEFKRALEPLQNNNLLLTALLQFPESFHYEKEERIYLDNLIKELKEIPLTVEMRNTKWQTDQVYQALKQRNAAWCITDNPNLKNLPKLEYITTNELAYIRFHGRNSQMWYQGNNISRYDYLYSDSELQSFIEPLKELLKHTKTIQLFFNNHAKSQATVNAKKIEMLLKE